MRSVGTGALQQARRPSPQADVANRQALGHGAVLNQTGRAGQTSGAAQVLGRDSGGFFGAWGRSEAFVSRDGRRPEPALSLI